MLKRAVYIWELPVRIYHWVNVVLLTLLLISGFFIGAPYLAPSGEAYENFLMGWMRIWHAWAAWLFISIMIIRLYWSFKGNSYAKILPERMDFIKDGIKTLQYYLFLRKEHSLHAGHNVIAQLSYFFVMWIGSFFMILTGLALQGETHPGGFQDTYFGWLIPLFGSSYALRSYHHLTAWLFVVFIIGHLYMVFRQDILDNDGTVSSMVNGHKYLLADGEGRREKD